jgi:hypothetical protein
VADQVEEAMSVLALASESTRCSTSRVRPRRIAGSRQPGQPRVIDHRMLRTHAGKVRKRLCMAVDGVHSAWTPALNRDYISHIRPGFSRFPASLMGLKKAVLRWFAAAPTRILAVANMQRNSISMRTAP